MLIATKNQFINVFVNLQYFMHDIFSGKSDFSVFFCTKPVTTCSPHKTVKSKLTVSYWKSIPDTLNNSKEEKTIFKGGKIGTFPGRGVRGSYLMICPFIFVLRVVNGASKNACLYVSQIFANFF